MRYSLTPVPAVRAYGVDRVFRDGSRARVKTFEESEIHQALRLLAKLNGTLRRCE